MDENLQCNYVAARDTIERSRKRAEAAGAPVSEASYRGAHPERLRMYDVQIDLFRDVTQEDIDQLSSGTQAYGRLVHEFDRTKEWLDALRKTWSSPTHVR